MTIKPRIHVRSLICRTWDIDDDLHSFKTRIQRHLQVCFHSLEGKTSITSEFGWFLGVADTNDVIQKIEKTLNNTHTTTQKRTDNSFRNTKKHPEFATLETRERLERKSTPQLFLG